MKPQALYVTLVVFAAVLGALPPLAESQGRPNPPASPTPWPCCDDCGMCTRSFPPKCKCSDASPHGCHPACKDCVRSRSRGSDGTPLFVCNDLIENFCLRSCTPATTA